MKPYTILNCPNTEDISKKIYQYLEQETDLLTSKAIGWQFLEYKNLLRAVPELTIYFKELKLAPNSASAVILYETGQLPLHIDELPVVAKINFPVSNTQGWVTQWYSISEEILSKQPKKINQFGALVEDLSRVPKTEFTLLAELHDQSLPVVFNSRIPHVVNKLSGDSPRIIVSFTFMNEPRNLL